MPLSNEDVKNKLFWYEGRVERVIDGDTCILLCDVGFNSLHRLKCRFARINAPEMTIPDGSKTRDYVKSKVEGKKVLIQSKEWDKYGRALVEIYYQSDKKSWINLNDELVSNGLARFSR